MSCQLKFSDKVTTCIFRQSNAVDGKNDISHPSIERLRLALTELNKIPLLARVTQKLNRSFGFVDTEYRKRTIECYLSEETDVDDGQ